MIICYNDSGCIELIYADPVPDGLARHLREEGRTFITVKTELTPLDVTISSYVHKRRLTPRPVIGVTQDDATIERGELLVIDGLPVPITVKIDGEAIFVDDGSLEFLAEDAGNYSLEIDQWPYMPWRKKVFVR